MAEMTFRLVVIAIVLILILGALERGNSIKTAQAEAESERRDAEELEAQQQHEYATFFAVNGYPHRNDSARVAAWAAKRGWSPEKAYDFLLDAEVQDGISEALDAS